MSLVAYAASSDEDSDYDDEQQQTKAVVLLPTVANGHISDDEDFAPVEAKLEDITERSAFTLTLPKPKNVDEVCPMEVDDIATAFDKLPLPKSAQAIEEEDDEFLHKKATAIEDKPAAKGPVKITIPSLKEFSDVDKDMAVKAKGNKPNHQLKGSGLLGLLPQAKSEQNFARAAGSHRTPATLVPDKVARPTSMSSATTTKSPAFVPDCVKYRRPAHNTEDVDGVKFSSFRSKKVEPTKTKASLVNCSDSEASGEDEEAGGGDFFALNADVQLPEVSSNEINALVAKKAAQIANATTTYLTAAAAEAAKEDATEATGAQTSNEQELRLAQKRYHEQRLESDAVQALVGGNAKRRRKQAEQIQVMDISSDQVLPNRDDWMRSALAGATSYQPTGVLVDEEPAAGTRRKHQITYLAHKAKANEAELQAMWAANRQNRRATQSKYGF